MPDGTYIVAAFYAFAPLSDLETLRKRLLEAMDRHLVKGTVIIAEEGFNAGVSGSSEGLDEFLRAAGSILGTKLEVKYSRHDSIPYKRRKVKIKDEIVTFRKKVDLSAGEGTHVDPSGWNRLLEDPETLVLDTRNDYEVAVGRFKGAVDPAASSFSELAEFARKNLDPATHRRVAMYCTGGIRCEKFAPYLKQMGFAEVYQLKGGILKYLEVTPPEQSLWEGECFVFDERVSVDETLRKGEAEDPSVFKNRPGPEGE